MKVLYEDNTNNRVLIATDNSKNPKTGPMIQTWILDTKIHPMQAIREGKDSNVCGDCKRSSKLNNGDGSCYVQVGFAPSSIWKKYKRQSDNIARNEFTEPPVDQQVRLGAYGDPALIPLFVWITYLSKSKGWTGYTHQWKTCDPGFKRYCMASVDSIEEAVEAQSLGWRTFRVDKTGERLYGEARCPASKEAGKRLQCINCPSTLKCNGSGLGIKKYNIVIREH